MAVGLSKNQTAQAFTGQQLAVRMAWSLTKSVIKNHPFLVASVVLYVFRHEIYSWLKEKIPEGAGQHPVETAALLGIICVSADYYLHQDEYLSLFCTTVSPP